jgi:hypothetical protein
MKRWSIACFSLLMGFMVLQDARAIDTGLQQAVQPALQADQSLVQKLAGIRVLNNPKGVTSLTSAVYADLNGSIVQRKLPVADAVRRQRDALLAHPDVAEAREMPGSNLLVRFKDNNELLMIMGSDRMGGAQDDLLAANTAAPLAPSTGVPSLGPNVMVPNIPSTPPRLLSFAMPKLPCTSNRAVAFDCLADDLNKVSPSVWLVAVPKLVEMGYSVAMYANDTANLDGASKLDNLRPGVVFMRGHGCALDGNDFAFLVRPWYTSYPPANTQYIGTIRVSAERHFPTASDYTSSVQYGYAITSAFAAAYWQDARFPGTVFFLESCHGTDPKALPGMPTWVLNHGAKAWVGWNSSVTFTCGDQGTRDFFTMARQGKNFWDVITAIYSAGCRPPELTLYTGGLNLYACKIPYWYMDNNEAVSDERDFKALHMLSENGMLYLTTLFYSTSALGEFHVFIDTNGDGSPENEVACRQDAYSIFKKGSSGLCDQLVSMYAPVKDGDSYMICIPWDVLGSNSIQFYLYDDVGKDRMPGGNATYPFARY